MLLAAPVGSTPTKVLLLEPVSLNPAPEPAQVTAVDAQLTWALSRRAGVVLVRSDALLVNSDHPNADVIAKVRGLVRGGEDHYMAFQFTPAAAALSEAAETLLDLIGQLDADQLKLLRRALLLEGSSWAEAKRPDLAVAAFAELQARAGSAAIDMSLVSPKAQVYWQQATNKVRARGSTNVALESDPTGADVYLDGELRGRTPLLLNSVPLGAHHLTLRHPGFDPVQQSLQVGAETPRQRYLLAERPAMAALKRLLQGAPRGVPLDEALQADVKAVAQAAGVQAVLLVGVSGGDGARVILQRFNRAGGVTHTVAVVLDNFETDVAQAVDALVGNPTPPVGLPDAALNNLDFERGLLGQHFDSHVAAPSMHVDAGQNADDTHGLWQSVSVWGGAGTALFSGFGPEYRGAINSSWGGSLLRVDGQLGYGYSAEAHLAEVHAADASVALRVHWELGRVDLGAGLFVGGEMAIERALAGGFSGLRTQLAPNGGALVRVDVNLTDSVFLGVMGTVRVEGLRVLNGATDQAWRFPLQYGGMLGVGWRL